MKKSKVLLVIRDGWGYLEKEEGNAIRQANVPFDQYLLTNTEQVLLQCHGEAVGLPPGFQGSSEVGHMNMGAGRIVEQEVTRIFRAIQDGSLFHSHTFDQVTSMLEKSGTTVHLFGLLQDEGVHAHQEHLFQIIKYLKETYSRLSIVIHPIADGRDTPPRSFITFFDQLQEVILKYEQISIGSIWGRYYGMDRSKNVNLIKIAYEAMMFGKGKRVSDFREEILSAYENEVTPDNEPMFDEYLRPLISESYQGMNPGDVVINFNYRQDRAIQISKAFTDSSYPIYAELAAKLHYFGLTQYYDEFKNYLINPISEGASMNHILGEVLSGKGLKQLRISETQKFRHVTSFFNGKRTEPFPQENQVEIPSQYDPSTFASHPEMNAKEIAEEVMIRLNQDYDFIAVNFANCDMVGHTGILKAAKIGAEVVDKYVKMVTKAAMSRGYTILITADHGNSEEMVDAKGGIKTSHTTNPVKLHMLSESKALSFTTDHGILSDIAPLILSILEIEVPKEMSSRHLYLNLKKD